MGIRVWWHDEAHRILSSEWSGAVAMEAYQTADQQVRAMLDSVEHPVIGIIDWTHLHFLPENWAEILVLGRENFHHRLSHVIVVRGGLAWETVEVFNHGHEAGTRILRNFYYNTATFDEALALIAAGFRSGPLPPSQHTVMAN